MKCSCPKCSSPISEDLPEVPAKGINCKCTSCGQSYWLHREPFALRAYAVDGRRYCVLCGEDIQSGIHCPGCGAGYPEYCVVQSKKLVRRIGEGTKFTVSLPARAGKSAPSGAMAPAARAGGGQAEQETRVVGKISAQKMSLLVKVLAGLVLVAAVALGGMVYTDRQGQKDYAEKFVFALYLLKAGSEQGQGMAGTLAGGTPLSDKDLGTLGKSKSHIAGALQALSPPPERYQQVYGQLQGVHGAYQKLYTLCATSSPAPEVAEKARQLDGEFTKLAKGVKSSFPAEFDEALTAALPKYRNLKFLTE